MKFQVLCPKCAHPTWAAPPDVGAKTNCVGCGRVFEVPPPPVHATLRARALETVADPQMARSSLSAYAALSPHGVGPGSSMRQIQDVFPQTPEEADACDRLGLITSRLAVDLFLYPLWKHEGGRHEL